MQNQTVGTTPVETKIENPVRCNWCNWSGDDTNLIRAIAADEPQEDAADVCPQCSRIGYLMDLDQSDNNASIKEAS